MASSNRPEWFEELPCSVMICDKKFNVVYMNDKAAEDLADDGGRELVGTDLMDCHPPAAQVKLREVLASARPNVYTTEEGRKKKLVYQCRWKKGGRVGGVVQLVIELPRDIPHHVG
ncbi:MAG TPA: PAS domain-containing protein [Nitrososphaerales archaeon]|nr:PAS domain-containing protein [Nitrososphaerales archaeon]